ncbi:MAG: hypothetical protein QJR08_03855 [Bacillota bacterium]|nr:hypothetical protein [Bacillota bacterium]
MPFPALAFDGRVAEFRRYLLRQRESRSERRRASRALAEARIAAITRQIVRQGPDGPRAA